MLSPTLLIGIWQQKTSSQHCLMEHETNQQFYDALYIVRLGYYAYNTLRAISQEIMNMHERVS